MNRETQNNKYNPFVIDKLKHLLVFSYKKGKKRIKSKVKWTKLKSDFHSIDWFFVTSHKSQSFLATVTCKGHQSDPDKGDSRHGNSPQGQTMQRRQERDVGEKNKGVRKNNAKKQQKHKKDEDEQRKYEEKKYFSSGSLTVMHIHAY